MASSASEVHLLELGACLCFGSVLGIMISVSGPDEQLLAVWVCHKALPATCSYREHFADAEQIVKRNRLITILLSPGRGLSSCLKKVVVGRRFCQYKEMCKLYSLSLN